MDNVAFEDFKKLDLRVGEIKSAEDVPGADKIYKLKVDVGEERELVAGIKQFYTIEELIGKKIIVICNLEPRMIRGINSHGMLFAASTPEKDQVVLATVEKAIINGARVS